VCVKGRISKVEARIAPSLDEDERAKGRSDCIARSIAFVEKVLFYKIMIKSRDTLGSIECCLRDKQSQPQSSKQLTG
jgi:hypothetical protein